MLPPITLSVYLFVCWLSGIAIGAVGIGGVLLMPVLLLCDVPVDVAQPTVLATFALPGLIGTASYARRGRLPWRIATLLTSGVLLGAAAGAMLLPVVPHAAISALVIGVALFVGAKVTVQTARVMWRRGPAMPVKPPPPLPSHAEGAACGRLLQEESLEPPAPLLPVATSALPLAAWPETRSRRVAWVAIGVLVGALSVLTATGGPFILLPLLLSLEHRLRVPPAEAVALALACGVPVSAVATPVLALQHVPIDLGLAACISLAVAAGSPVGVRLALRVRREHLQLAIGLVLLGIGAAALAKVAQHQPAGGRGGGAPEEQPVDTSVVSRQ